MIELTCHCRPDIGYLCPLHSSASSDDTRLSALSPASVGAVDEKQSEVLHKAQIASFDRFEHPSASPASVGAGEPWDALRRIWNEAEDCPELNMSNYDHDQVDLLNKAMIAVWQIATEALSDHRGPSPATPTKQAGQGGEEG